MPTNENIVDPLVQQILAAGYTPITPDEWIISALNYLYGAGSGGGLLADGTITGATSQTQVFTNGVTPSNIAAFSLVVTDITQKLISGGVLTGNATLFPQVNALETGFNFVNITGSVATDNEVVTARVISTAALPGAPVLSAGGQTLTRGSNGTVGTIDGVTPFAIGDRIALKNQADQKQNGVWEFTIVGSAGAAAYVLNRPTDSDTTAELDGQVITASEGTANKGLLFTQNTNNPVINTDNIVYTQTSSVFVTQGGAGTQVANQIPYYLAQARRISKGEAGFTYNPTTNTLLADNVDAPVSLTSPSVVITNDGNISDAGGTLSITFDDTGDSLLLTAGTACSISTAGASFIAAGTTATINGTDVVVNATDDFVITAIDIDASAITGDFLLPNSTISNDGSFDFISKVILNFGADRLEVSTVHVMLASLQDFASNALAVAAGLVTGDLFYTNTAGEATVKIVL